VLAPLDLPDPPVQQLDRPGVVQQPAVLGLDPLDLGASGSSGVRAASFSSSRLRSASVVRCSPRAACTFCLCRRCISSSRSASALLEKNAAVSDSLSSRKIGCFWTPKWTW
jgi:hypothetical protein